MFYGVIKAKFKGTESLGYKPNVEYYLSIQGNVIRRLDGTGRCPYGSLASFLANWDNIRTIRNNV